MGWWSKRKAERARRRWADANVLGGWPAYQQALGVVRDAVRDGKRRARELEERQRGLAFWPRLEAAHDEALLDALALTIVQREGETLEAYDDRLRAFYAALRARLEPAPALYVDGPPAPARARASDRPPTNAPSPSDVPVAVLSRKELKKLRSEFWRSHGRLPTPREVAELHAAR